jgi:hypothetical protein
MLIPAAFIDAGRRLRAALPNLPNLPAGTGPAPSRGVSDPVDGRCLASFVTGPQCLTSHKDKACAPMTHILIAGRQTTFP